MASSLKSDAHFSPVYNKTNSFLETSNRHFQSFFCLSFFFSLIAKRNRWPEKSEEKSNFKGYKVPLEKSKVPSRIVSQDVGFFMWISVVSVAILSRRFMCARNVSQLVYCGFTLGLAVVQRRSFEPREATLKAGAFSTTPKFKISSHLSSR